MTDDGWDAASNSNEDRERQRQAGIAEEHRIRQEQWAEESSRWAEDARIRRRSRGEMEIPVILEEEVRRDFATHQHTDSSNRYSQMHAPYTANRIMQICHDCGYVSFKERVYELTKCNAYRCTSRNITIIRSGDISRALRNLPRNAGFNMAEVFAERRTRQREARRARRTA